MLTREVWGGGQASECLSDIPGARDSGGNAWPEALNAGPFSSLPLVCCPAQEGGKSGFGGRARALGSERSRWDYPSPHDEGHLALCDWVVNQLAI